MKDQLEDWQLGLLIEAKRYDDPTVIEAAAKDTYRKHEDFLSELQSFDDPVIVERPVAESYERNESLREAAEGIDNPVVGEKVEEEEKNEALEAVDEFLSKALRDHHNLRDDVVERMDVPSMVAQFRNEEDDSIEFTALTQNVETGGAPSEEEEEEDENGGDVESLSADDRKTVKENLERADQMEKRTPSYAETLRNEATEILGVEDYEDIDLEVL